ncbi:MAG: hypothetical protein JW774_02405, partial [Candidatus Aureabacteria bacterium]|nr:hypothetical protein [Candidatus Auribacterota bacterium]
HHQRAWMNFLLLKSSSEMEKDWRPNSFVFSADPDEKETDIPFVLDTARTNQILRFLVKTYFKNLESPLPLFIECCEVFCTSQDKEIKMDKLNRAFHRVTKYCPYSKDYFHDEPDWDNPLLEEFSRIVYQPLMEKPDKEHDRF